MRRSLVAFVGFLTLALCSTVGGNLSAQQSVTGQWQNGPNFPFFPVDMHMLPDTKVLIWPGDGGVSGDDPRLWNPATNSVTTLSHSGFDIFCSGHSFLPDGRLFVAGGHISNNIGLPEAAIYDPVNNTWVRQQRMNLGRWYPTTTVLQNGDVLTISGDVDLTTGENPVPQVWQAATGTWRSLTNAQLRVGLYPYAFLSPNGKVFNAGPSVTTRYLDTTGTGSWTVVGNRTYNRVRDYGSAVMYRPGKIMVVGGSDPPTNTAEVIDLNAAAPAWRAVGTMAFARRQMNATMLPDGKVLVTGGTSSPGFNNGSSPAYAAEMWDPATEEWTTLASATVPRLYHSMSMLLADGRLITTGGNGYTQTEYFSPPYLFAGPRPTITSVPATVANGQTLTITTPDAARITAVSWIRQPSITHTNTMSQAFYSSTQVTQVTGGVSIVAPNNPTVPPGYYMLFVLANGVPSIAKMIRLGPPSANNPVPTITSIAPSSTTAGGPQMTLTVNGSNFVAGSTMRWNGSNRATTFVSATQLSAAISAADIQSPGTAQVSVLNPGNVASVARTFTITPSCSAPSSAGVNVCSPVNGSTVSSPVTVQAASTITGTLARMEVWVDGVKKFTETTSKSFTTSIALPTGSHRFDIYAVNTAGTNWLKTVNATVK